MILKYSFTESHPYNDLFFCSSRRTYVNCVAPQMCSCHKFDFHLVFAELQASSIYLVRRLRAAIYLACTKCKDETVMTLEAASKKEHPPCCIRYMSQIKSLECSQLTVFCRLHYSSQGFGNIPIGIYHRKNCFAAALTIGKHRTHAIFVRSLGKYLKAL